MPPIDPDKLRDPAAERAVLGAALNGGAAASRVAEKLETADFSSPLSRSVYRTIAVLYAYGREMSPAVIHAELGPDRTAELEISVDDLQVWALDSPAIEDPILLEHQLEKLQKLRVRRRYSSALQQALLLDPFESGDGDRREVLEDLLAKAGDNLSALYSLNGVSADLHTIDLQAVAEAEPETIPWVFPSWLAEGDVCMIAGEPGVGKSWVLLDLAFCLASGRSKWLDHINVVDPESGRPIAELQEEKVWRPQRVLLIDEENNERLVRYRVQRLARGREMDAAELGQLPVRYLVENGLNLDDENAWRRIGAEIKAFRPDWIMFDSLVRFHQRNENDNAAMSEFFMRRLRPLRQVASENGAGLVMLHHLRKVGGDQKSKSDWLDRIRGAGDMRGWLDELWGLEEDKDGGSLILRQGKCRWGASAPPLKMEIDDVLDRTGVRLISTGRADDAGGAILRELETSGMIGVLRQELIRAVQAEGVSDCGRVTSRHLKALYVDGTIRKLRQGKNTRYFLQHFSPADAE